MSERRFVLVDIGCIECDEPTSVVGVYRERIDAEVAAERLPSGGEGDYSDGQHVVEIFEVELSDG